MLVNLCLTHTKSCIFAIILIDYDQNSNESCAEESDSESNIDDTAGDGLNCSNDQVIFTKVFTCAVNIYLPLITYLLICT